MPAATCIRCFAVFGFEDARPGAAPVCPACATALAAAQPVVPTPGAAPSPARRRLPRLRELPRRVLIGAGVALALLAAAGAAAVVRWFML